MRFTELISGMQNGNINIRYIRWWPDVTLSSEE